MVAFWPSKKVLSFQEMKLPDKGICLLQRFAYRGCFVPAEEWRRRSGILKEVRGTFCTYREDPRIFCAGLHDHYHVPFRWTRVTRALLALAFMSFNAGHSHSRPRGPHKNNMASNMAGRSASQVTPTQPRLHGACILPGHILVNERFHGSEIVKTLQGLAVTILRFVLFDGNGSRVLRAKIQI